MEIVQFKNGRFGIRKKSWFGKYVFYSPYYRDWSSRDKYTFAFHCEYFSQEDAERCLHSMNDMGTPVKKVLEIG